MPNNNKRVCIPGTIQYVVKNGDTIYSISQQYDVEVDYIALFNPDVDAFNLQVGDIICIPEIPEEPIQIGCDQGFQHVVKPGDNLYKLSRQYNVPIGDIILSNLFIDPYDLQIGDSICIPKPRQACPGETYVVEAGDTLYLVTRKFDVSYKDLVLLNPEMDPKNLNIGESLCIPQKMESMCPQNEYIIMENETLESIAEKNGVGTDEMLIYNANLSPNQFVAGVRICIPPKFEG